MKKMEQKKEEWDWRVFGQMVILIFIFFASISFASLFTKKEENMELLPRQTVRIKQQVKEYNNICGTKLTTRQWTEKLLSLGDDALDDARRQLVSGLSIERGK
jgi:hypothetical protein